MTFHRRPLSGRTHMPMPWRSSTCAGACGRSAKARATLQADLDASVADDPQHRSAVIAVDASPVTSARFALAAELGAQQGDLLDHCRQVLAPGGQLVDLGMQPSTRRYSTRHGRGSVPRDLAVLRRTYVRVPCASDGVRPPLLPLRAGHDQPGRRSRCR